MNKTEKARKEAHKTYMRNYMRSYGPEYRAGIRRSQKQGVFGNLQRFITKLVR